jgi:formylmethanofuran dehydrogenase subunit B
MGALLAAGWAAGSPLPFAHLGDGETVHDPFRYDAGRLIASGECDAVLWLDTLGEVLSATGRTPCVAIGLAPTPGAAVSFLAGRPGVDHDGVLYRGEIATLANHPATHPRSVATAAAVIAAIDAALPCRRGREAGR